ncbi:MAG: PilN domain-containing protein [Coriobacteriia bacterium]|nr:PilN domain-containing protein [Coriobacteriia bacterium]MBN2822640.1 PilN domain-containing protein [Coriobacteriia bacterium]
MMRINLLPPEILEKRRAEKRIIYVALLALLVFIVLAVVWIFAFVRVDAKQQDLDARLQEIQATQSKADMLAIFEDKEQDLQARQVIADAALADRMNWAKLFDEVSLVMPTDLWVTNFSWDEATGLTIDGYAVDSATDSPDLGHKSIAKMLVRLADLDDLYDVWLENAVKMEYANQPAIQFSSTARVLTSTSSPSAGATTTSVPGETSETSTPTATTP